MERIVPLTGAGVRGPLGVAHLPRLWLKASLSAVGLLAEGYKSGGDYGIDQMVVNAIGLDPIATFAYLESLPSYLAFEAWVRDNATGLDPTSVAASNAAVGAQRKGGESAAATRARIGLADTSIDGSVLLNDLDDWYAVHGDVVTRRATGRAPIVPAISSSTAGPLGAVHLPRLWLKATLKATGALPPGYNSGPGGFDGFALANLGIDMAASVAYIDATRPPYLVYEAWAVANGRRCDAAGIAAHNAAAHAREKPVDRATIDRDEIGTSDLSLRHNIVLNDLVDWKALHATVIAQRAVATR